MIKNYSFAYFCLSCVFIFFSCAAGPKVLETPPEYEAWGGDSTGIVISPHSAPPRGLLPARVIPTLVSTTMPDSINIPEDINIPDGITMQDPDSDHLEMAMVPDRPPLPETPLYIMGKGIVSPEDMAAFLLEVNPEADRYFVENLARYYVEEAAVEGVNHDVAFAQMCLETGYLRFGNLVAPEQNNFAGLGATGPGRPGLDFPDPRTGVRAQIQHLKAYATDAPLNHELVNPRYFLVRLGSAPAIRGLAGTWAADPLYADKINNILERLYFFSF